MNTMSNKQRLQEAADRRRQYGDCRTAQHLPWADGCYRLWLTEKGASDVCMVFKGDMTGQFADASYARQEAYACMLAYKRSYLLGLKPHEGYEIQL